MSFFQGKNVLVTGGTGLIGRPLVEMLDNSGANIRIVSLDTPTEMPARTEFISADLREFANCAKAVKDIEVVFHLAGVKGSPAMASQRPASFMVPTVTFSFNMMEAARRAEVERYLFTSSVGVYAPSDHFLEDDVWKTFPSPNDRFAGWAKRMGELQAEAYAIEYGWDKISIVRPANVYGPYDNFDPENSHVIPGLIYRFHQAKVQNLPHVIIWGSGTVKREFLFVDDMVSACIQIMNLDKEIFEKYSTPRCSHINVGSGFELTVSELSEIIKKVVGYKGKIKFDKSKPDGSPRKLVDSHKINEIGFKAKVNLDEGIVKTYNNFLKELSNSQK